MFAVLLALTAVSLFLILYFKWVRVRSYWAERNVPHNPPHPFFGSLTHLQKKNSAVWFRDLYVAFEKTPYIGVWLFWKPALVINCPELARRILVKDFDCFRDRHLSSGKSDPIGALNIFTVNDPLWSSIRKKLTSVFTTAKMKTYQPMILKKSKELVQRIDADMEQNKVVDLKNVYTDYTTDLVGEVSFGVESNGTLTGDCAMRRVTRSFQSYSVYRAIGHTCVWFLPEAIDWLRFSFFPKDTISYFRKLLESVVQQRGGFNRSTNENRDLVDALIKIKQDDPEVTFDLLTSQAAILVQGGFETTASALTFITYELAYAPEAQEKLYQELVDLKERIGDKDFSMDDLADAKYLNAVLKEGPRKYPPMGWIDRISTKEYKLDDNLTIPAGIPCYVNAVATQMDPDYFPEPERFVPERFLPENEKDIKPFTYLPFGEGPRVCIGQRFAHHSMRYALAMVMMSYKVVPRPGAPLPNDCELETRSHFLLPGEVLAVDFIPRV